MKPALYLGLMSGTSMDAVDAAVAEFRGTRFAGLRATHSVAYPRALREQLLTLARTLPPLTLADYCALDQAVARVFARAATGVLRKARIAPARIAAIGSHGQTVFHQPQRPVRSTLQLGDPSLVAGLTGITTVADFRRADVALGGQGAPLVPAFHHALFAAAEPRCVVNVGGIANVTLLPGRLAQKVSGFDTGPGNGLMDEWTRRHRGRGYDAWGRWAASGRGHAPLLAALLLDPYFARKPPKSTGRGDFNLEWLTARYPGIAGLPPADVQRTLGELTVVSIAQAIRRHAPRTRRVLVCGGGAFNGWLMGRLADELAPARVESTAGHGLDPQWVEAAAFAWLAMRTLHGLPGNVPAVTGASRPAVLGGIYRA